MFHRIFADNTRKQSVASRLRQKRFHLFINMLDEFPTRQMVKILDVGGTQEYWEMMADGSELLDRIHVTLLNIQHQETSMPNFRSVTGDAREMREFDNGVFDIVFSNSTIEHVGSYQDQKRMADEVMRVGRQYYIQTPNRNFPIEPHFVFPFFQFLPIAVRVWLVQHFKLGWFPKMPDPEQARSEVMGIRLITIAEFQDFFPEADIYEEKYFGFTKSFVAHSNMRKTNP